MLYWDETDVRPGRGRPAGAVKPPRPIVLLARRCVTWLRVLAVLLAVSATFVLGVLAGSAVSGAAVPGRWVWPVGPPHQVTRSFAPPATAYGRGHRGVDLAAPPGAPIRAAGAGVVSFASPLAGRGVITVRHAGGLRTTYEPVTASVRVGQPVAVGAPIGRLAAGHLDCPAAACLHWGLLRGADYLDPLALLGLVQVRLLPLDGRRPAASASVDRPG
ncbi:MAG: murein hydrolase activator EnvC family protein, partial [Mycobacteriales bacterium]